ALLAEQLQVTVVKAPFTDSGPGVVEGHGLQQEPGLLRSIGEVENAGAANLAQQKGLAVVVTGIDGTHNVVLAQGIGNHRQSLQSGIQGAGTGQRVVAEQGQGDRGRLDDGTNAV